MLWCISSMVKNSMSLAQEQLLCICDIILVPQRWKTIQKQKASRIRSLSETFPSAPFGSGKQTEFICMNSCTKCNTNIDCVYMCTNNAIISVDALLSTLIWLLGLKMSPFQSF